MKVKSENEVPQSCLTLSDPMDCSLPGSSVHGISCFKIVMITFRIMSKSLRRRFSVIYPLSASPIESLLAFLLILSSHICRLVLWEGTCWLVLPYLGMAQMPSVLLHSCLQMCPSSSVTSSASLPWLRKRFHMSYFMSFSPMSSMFYNLIYPLLCPETLRVRDSYSFS